MKRQLLRLGGLLLLCSVALQAAFALRVAAMRFIDPQSSSFQRSEAWRLLTEQHRLLWSHQWVDRERISRQLDRAVIASEDSGFVDHNGVEWDAIEKAWAHDQRALARPTAHAKIVGGSTISQQLAKNMLLSGERTILRKAQEFAITMMLEAMLSKQRILEIYLNNVEWGEGLYGAQAAARHYFHVDAARLSAEQAARLAVMLPAPKRFEKRPGSPYVVGRAATIVARMPAVELP
ncbi:MAG: monofunctional biosynthetic peptidoglycan transglycosylase [Burkholderiales bacterium]|nr:monofunctional biosynthetic peptidoglycan transglycosylase [Burkholderiales bacterium]MDE2394699.1 monofunctional biosynthetic peptidoglycan transglycosylase [Burkholderiales bacterium]MDE2455826.1 monofunctional biosynthetic peptidoglycan transglycosylase [Burkholderiales bacterium]